MNGFLIKMSISIYSLCCNDVNSPIDMSPLHMPLLMLMIYMHIDKNDGSVFIVPPYKKN